MLTNVVPRWPRKEINQSQFYSYDVMRSRFPHLKRMRFPRSVCSPWESGGVGMDIRTMSYNIEEADGPRHVSIVQLYVNTSVFVCLCCDHTTDPLPLILPDSRVPYARLVPRSVAFARICRE